MIPKDAREVYLDEKSGEPIAYCPKESLGLTDIHRAEFYALNKDRLAQLARRARERTRDEGSAWCVVCINVDDPIFTFLVDLLMPGHPWQEYRDRGETPVARGVVPLDLLATVTKEIYPAAGDVIEGRVNIFVCASGGIAIIAADE